MYGSQLSDQERLQLQEELGLRGADTADRAVSTTQRGQDLSYDQVMRELALREWDYGNQDYYRRAGI